MTKGRVAEEKGFLRLEVYFLAVKSKTLHVVVEGLAVFVTFGSLALFLVAVQGR
jgi:zinc transporter ZupT